MRITVIGGREKDEARLSEIAAAAGHRLEFETGHVHGQGVEAIQAAVSRSELVVILTAVNSHGAVHVAKRAARRFRKPTLIIDKISGARLRGLIDAIERRRQIESSSAFCPAQSAFCAAR